MRIGYRRGTRIGDSGDGLGRLNFALIFASIRSS